MKTTYNLDDDLVHKWRKSDSDFVKIPGFDRLFAPASEVDPRWWPDEAMKLGFVSTLPPDDLNYARRAWKILKTKIVNGETVETLGDVVHRPFYYTLVSIQFLEARITEGSY